MTEEPLTRRERQIQQANRGFSHAPDPNRSLPASIEAEKGVLCSVLLDQQHAFTAAIEKGVSAETFHIPAHGSIWQTILGMWDKRIPIDIVTLTEVLYKRGLLDEVGGSEAVCSLFTYLPTAANVEYYVETLMEKHTLREAIRVGTLYASRAYEEADDVDGIIGGFEQSVLGIRKFRRREAVTVAELVIQVMGDFQASFDRKGGIAGLSTGLHELDVQIDGLHRAEMIVIAARPSHGKTAIAMNMVEEIAIVQGLPVGIFSLEMSARQLVMRLICSRARINYFRWRDGFRTQDDCDRLAMASDEISRAPISIDDTSAITIQELRAKARRWRADEKIEALFIDYLQLATTSTKRGRENRQQEVAEVSAGCKSTAKDCDIPVIVLAQLDRGVDKEKRRPRLSDLRESGAIEQDADTVAALTNEELLARDDEERQQLRGKATLEILKQRNGPLGPVNLTFFKEYTRFECRLEADAAEPSPQMNFEKLNAEVTEQSQHPADVENPNPRRRGYQRNGD